MDQPPYNPTEDTMRDTLTNPFAVTVEALRYYDENGTCDPGIHDAIDLFERLSTLASQVTVAEDEKGTSFRLDALERTVNAAFSLHAFYALQWRVDNETADDIEQQIALDLVATQYCRQLQKERPRI